MACTSCLTCTVHVMHVMAMNLSQYLSANGITDEAFAQQIERDRSFVTKLRQGKARPSVETLSKIKSATNGAVTADAFMPSEAAQ